MTETLWMGALLLVIMLVLLAGGVWIAMTLADRRLGRAGLLHQHAAGQEPVLRLLGEQRELGAGGVAALHLDGRDPVSHQAAARRCSKACAPWLNRVPGRLMHTTILGCGVFGSVSGSSAATCATIAKVALPELKRRGYDEKMAIGSLATAGTLGILIPPSITMVVYAVAADASIIRIFLAGFLPGLLLMVLFSRLHRLVEPAQPGQGAAGRPADHLLEKIRLSGNLIPCALLIVFIVLGAGGRLGHRHRMRGLRRAGLAGHRRLGPQPHLDELQGRPDGRHAHQLHDHVHPGRRGLPDQDHGLHRHPARAGRVGRRDAPLALRADRRAGVVYLVLGTALDGISMIVLTSAVVLPMIQKAGFDLVWFGIFIVLLVEIAEVTPPVGFNLFVLQNMTGKDSNVIAKAAIPFFFCLVVCIALITLFPSIVTDPAGRGDGRARNEAGAASAAC